MGIAPQLSDAELVTLAMMQAMLGFTSEARWLRHAHAHLRHLFPYLPKQPGYNKRLRKAAELVRRVTRELAADTALWTDDVWVVDSTPVECGRSRETARRSDLAGWAQYTYCASQLFKPLRQVIESRKSTRPSKDSSTSNGTTDAPPAGCPSASCSASSR